MIVGLAVVYFCGAIPTYADAPIKNVLFIVSDDLKASVLGCYGNTVCQTPNIDELARSGLVFNRAYCQGTLCAPSRLSFMYSRYKDNRGTNLGEHFKNNGWYSARVGKIYHMRVPGDIIAGTNGVDVPSSWTERFNSPGFEAHTPGDYACLNRNIFTTDLEGRESTKMPNRMFVSVQYQGDGSDQPDYKTTDKTIELLRKHKDKPFFIAAGLVRPHYPMVAPKRYFERYRWQDIDLPESIENDLADIPKLGMPKSISSKNGLAQFPENQKRMWAAYYAAVTFMDEQVGRILDELDQLRLRDSTAVVFLSDHGYHLGEHTFWLKKNLHEEVTRVPLVISAPGIVPGRTEAIVELIDLYPTLVELVGLSIPATVQGISLVPVLSNHSASIKRSALSFNEGASLREDEFAYMRYTDGTEELYDMVRDPKQFINQAGNPDYSTTLTQIRNRFDIRMNKAGISNRKKKDKKPTGATSQ